MSPRANVPESCAAARRFRCPLYETECWSEASGCPAAYGLNHLAANVSLMRSNWADEQENAEKYVQYARVADAVRRTRTWLCAPDC